MDMYFTALVLPAGLNERILPLKRRMQERYGCKVGLKSPAHITLLPPFWMHPSLEPELRADLDAFADTQSPFPVHTNHFSAFRPRTIFIDVVVDAALAALKVANDAWFGGRPQYGLKTDRRPFHPHITIATRDLRKSAFFECWPEFEAESFSATWIADDIGLLHHNGRHWDVVHRAAFVNRQS
ncbi:2'-5' RNA ligase family protein [Flaviaesturariibacter amylovorans]|uniref:2'-5' RNA ligase family protein n=1 Tax=Flaviaesturariibacter amylovorans TaxID=1084520 RepID=A0ABP8HS22_9BACT